jgi:hypothetical protein
MGVGAGASHLGRTTSVLSYAILAGGLFTIANAVRLAVTCYSRIPYWDMWAMVHYLVKPDRPLAAWLWMQHNEHRIVIPKLFYAADFRLFHGTEVFLLVCGFLILFAHGTALIWLLRARGGFRGSELRTAAGLTAMCLFSLSQWENFTTGFQICFFLLPFFVSVAVVALILHFQPAENHSWVSTVYLGVTICSATAATFSLGNGPLIWPVLLLIALAYRRLKTIVTVAIAGAVAIAAYLYQYRFAAGGHIVRRSLGSPLRVAEYVVRYFGAPWIESDLRWAAVFGCIGVVAALGVVAAFCFKRKQHAWKAAVIALLLFYLATAVLTALARQVVSVDQGALSNRYEAFALIFWLSLGYLVIRHAHLRGSKAFAGVQVLILVVMLIAGTRIKFAMREAHWRALVNNTAATALVVGVLDPAALAHVTYGGLDRARSDSESLQAQKKSVFATAWAHQLGTTLTAYDVRAEDCRGEATSEEAGIAEAHGLRVSGWAWDPIRQRAMPDLLIVSNRKIVGLAQGGFPRRDEVASKMRYTAFLGYTRPLPSNAIVVYGIVDSGPRLCRIAR